MTTTPTVYQFRQQLQKGQDYEHRLDRYFAEWFQITDATDAQQKTGIDREFRRQANGVTNRYTVEYKADERAATTGNAFIETISVRHNSPGRPDTLGWAFTSRADVLCYYIPGDELIYIIKFTKLRQNLPTWQAKYREVSVPNRNYTTHGLLLPLDEMERIAAQVISL